jgi:hypothetical protein
MARDQSIRAIEIDTIPDVQGAYLVGRNGVTQILLVMKPGMYSDIPYVRVLKGDAIEAEFCQHNIVGTYFFPPGEGPDPAEAAADMPF